MRRGGGVEDLRVVTAGDLLGFVPFVAGTGVVVGAVVEVLEDMIS